MAQIWTESCQWTTDPAKFARRYYYANPFYSATDGRNGGPAFRGPWTIIPTDPLPTGNVCVFFVRIKATGGDTDFLGINGPTLGSFNPSGGTWWAYVDCKLSVTTDGRLRLSNGWPTSTLIAQSPPGTVTAVGTEYGLAGKISIHPSAGTCDLWLDGVPVPGMTGLTGLNTALNGNTTWTIFVTDGFWRCDLFVADGSNPTGNDVHDLLPDVRVDYCPVNANGASSGFIGNDGNSTDNYAMVDELSPDDDGTYVQSLNPAVDSYGVQDAPVGMQLVGVTSVVTARKTDASVVTLKQGLRPTTTNYMGPAYAAPVSYVTHSRQHGVNPNGNAAWTEATFNATEVVIEKV